MSEGMSDHIDDLIRDTLTPKDKPPPTDAFRAVAEAAALREHDRWKNHRLILMKKQYVLNEKLILDARREAFGEALKELIDQGLHHFSSVEPYEKWLREQAGEGR